MNDYCLNLDFNKLNIGDWIMYERDEKKIFAQVQGKFKDGIITDDKEESKIKVWEKNIKVIIVRKANKRLLTWFKVNNFRAKKVLSHNEVGKLKTDKEVRSYIKLRGLDKP